VPELSPLVTQIAGLVVYSSMTSYYTVESRGKTKEADAVRGVRTIVKIDPLEKDGYKIVQWVDTLI
jgi:hypothetical protein